MIARVMELVKKELWGRLTDYLRYRKFKITMVSIVTQNHDAIDLADKEAFYYFQEIEGVSGRYYIEPIQ